MIYHQKISTTISLTSESQCIYCSRFPESDASVWIVDGRNTADHELISTMLGESKLSKDIPRALNRSANLLKPNV